MKAIKISKGIYQATEGENTYEFIKATGNTRTKHWLIKKNGKLEFNSPTLRGAIKYLTTGNKFYIMHHQ